MEYSITWRHKLCRAFTLDALASRPVACPICNPNEFTLDHCETLEGPAILYILMLLDVITSA